MLGLSNKQHFVYAVTASRLDTASILRFLLKIIIITLYDKFSLAYDITGLLITLSFFRLVIDSTKFPSLEPS